MKNKSSYDDIQVTEKEIETAVRYSSRVKIITLALYDFSGSLDKVLNHLTSLYIKYTELGYTNLCIDIDKYEDYQNIILFGDMEESTQELIQRLIREKKFKLASKFANQNKKDKELKQLASLAKKYNLKLSD